MANNKVPIEQGVIDQVSGKTPPPKTGLLATVGTKMREALYATGWFGPLQPLDVMVPQALQETVVGRQFDFQVGYNRILTPRNGEAVSFPQLRALADSCDVLRLVIETRKDQMSKLKWQIIPKDEEADIDPQCQELTDFFAFPDKEHDWDTWLRMLIEDLLVIDAPTLYVHKTVGGGVFGLDPIDGATIKRIIDLTGRTPRAPDTAYQQILKGTVADDYTVDEIIYRPRNIRTNKIYGYSPVEQVIMTVNIALRRAVHKLQYYTEGNVPEAIVGTPENWNSDQIAIFQKHWDALNEGNTAERRHMKFVPGKVDLHLVKEDVMKDAFDEWLARIVCFAFSIEPNAFVQHQNRATAESAREAALSEGLAPLMQWVQNLLNFIIAVHFKRPDLQFGWVDERVQDPLERAKVHQIYTTLGVLTPNEVREELGKEPFTTEQLAEIAATRAPPPMPIQPENENGPPPDKPPTPGIKEAVAKSKKVSPGLISRDRASIVKIENRTAKYLQTYLAKKGKLIAAKVAASSFGKADDPDPDSEEAKKKKIEDILNELGIDFDDSVDSMTLMLSVAATDGASAAFEQIGQDDRDVETVTQWAADRAAEMVGKKWVDGELVDNPDAEWAITDGTRDMLRGVISNAIDQGLSTDELASQIEDSFAFSEGRASMIARTETAMADSAGQVEAYKDSEVVEGTQWTTAEDDLVSDECNANKEAGVIPLGEVYPSGDEAPPAHTNCRCGVVAVLKKNYQDDTTTEYDQGSK